ncbi:hypothetical protein HDV02_004134 [Globomyces sp. JEL0801]|nr:hypothetical protein HDV02_004134 [Globomyces sp. JEL0801]
MIYNCFDIPNPLPAQNVLNDSTAFVTSAPVTSAPLNNLDCGWMDEELNDDLDFGFNEGKTVDTKNKESESHPMPQLIQDLTRLPKRFYPKNKCKQPRYPTNRRQTPYSADQSVAFDKPNHSNFTYGTKKEYANDANVLALQKQLKDDRNHRSSLHDQNGSGHIGSGLYSGRYQNFVASPTIDHCLDVILQLNRKVLRGVCSRWKTSTNIEVPSDPNRELCERVIFDVMRNKEVPTRTLWDSLIGINQQNTAVGVKQVVTLMRVLDLRWVAGYADTSLEIETLPYIALDGETNCFISMESSNQPTGGTFNSNSIETDPSHTECTLNTATVSSQATTNSNSIVRDPSHTECTLNTATVSSQATTNSNSTMRDSSHTESTLNTATVSSQSTTNSNSTVRDPSHTESTLNTATVSSQATTNSNSTVRDPSHTECTLNTATVSSQSTTNSNSTVRDPSHTESTLNTATVSSQSTTNSNSTVRDPSHTEPTLNTGNVSSSSQATPKLTSTVRVADVTVTDTSHSLDRIRISTPSSHEAYPLLKKLLDTGSKINHLQASLPRISEKKEIGKNSKVIRQQRKRKSKNTPATNNNVHEVTAEERYEVECILDEITKDGKTFYKVKWSEGSVSVEPAKNIQTDCPILVKEFKETLEFDQDISDKRKMTQIRRNGSHRSKRARNAMLSNK